MSQDRTECLIVCVLNINIFPADRSMISSTNYLYYLKQYAKSITKLLKTEFFLKWWSPFIIIIKKNTKMSWNKTSSSSVTSTIHVMSLKKSIITTMRFFKLFTLSQNTEQVKYSTYWNQQNKLKMLNLYLFKFYCKKHNKKLK